MEMLSYFLGGEEWLHLLAMNAHTRTSSSLFGTLGFRPSLKDSLDGWDPIRYSGFTRWQKAMMARKSVKHVLSVMGEQRGKKRREDLSGNTR